MTVANPRRVRVRNENGQQVNLASLPLVAYALNCSHLGREYAVEKGDIMFCADCGTGRKVALILAT